MNDLDNPDISTTLYNSLQQELETEKIAHLETKTKLLKTSEKLEVSLAEIQTLNRQLKQEKDAFQEAFGHLKDTAFEQKYHALMLKEKYNEIEKVCGQQDDIILMKETKIKDLSTKLNAQKKAHQHQLTDQDIHLQQERYLAQNLYKSQPIKKK